MAAGCWLGATDGAELEDFHYITLYLCARLLFPLIGIFYYTIHARTYYIAVSADVNTSPLSKRCNGIGEKADAKSCLQVSAHIAATLSVYLSSESYLSHVNVFVILVRIE